MDVDMDKTRQDAALSSLQQQVSALAWPEVAATLQAVCDTADAAVDIVLESALQHDQWKVSGERHI